MEVREIEVKNIMTKSKLPASDYAVNPYVGCPHKCKYCYACFMKRFTGHEEEWGEFIDIKNSRGILSQFVDTDVEIIISTKSKLVTRDLDILKHIKKVTVAFSINTMDEMFRRDMDRASSIEERIDAMELLHSNGIYTATFISPIFPEITDVIKIIDRTKGICDVFWLENLNLRGGYKNSILEYIEEKYPEYREIYNEIYNKKNTAYWIELSKKIESYAKKNNISVINYFYHDLIKKQ